MKNPLNKRYPRELKKDFGKYLVIFLFMVGTIGIVSGFLVANDSMTKAYDNSFSKYNIEDGNFELATKASKDLIDELEDQDVTIYSNTYKEEKTANIDSVLRIFINRDKVNKPCILKGRLASSKNEIAIDRMYANNNDLKVNDTITLNNKDYKIVGLIALSDYSALYSNNQDMIFDAMKFGVALMNNEGFNGIRNDNIHYSYSWQYNYNIKNTKVEKTKSDKLLNIINSKGMIKSFIPRYTNQAINFVGDDLKGDNAMVTVFLYIAIVIISFIIAITASTTISFEAGAIGTLRASGYSKKEMLLHYLTLPTIVIGVAAIVGNILGYTLFKEIIIAMYYGSYSLPTYVTIWNLDAFIKTTIIPLIILIVIIALVLKRKLNISIIKFLRRDLSKKKSKKAFPLKSSIKIFNRYRLRVIFQNLPNYLIQFIGIIFANFLLLFGLMLLPLLNNYGEIIEDNMISKYQYILKTEAPTNTKDAEKYCVTSLKDKDVTLDNEEIITYGIKDNSKYLKLDKDKTYISDAYSQKYNIDIGDTITLKEEYSSKEYKVKVEGIYDYPASLAIFMPMDDYHQMFKTSDTYFNGYFSNTKIKDIDKMLISSTITQSDLNKTTRQLKLSMGDFVYILDAFGVCMSVLIIYLLSKIIIEKNSNSISVAKILGYTNQEINRLYVMATSIVTILSIILSLPIIYFGMGAIMKYIFLDYPQYFPYYVSSITFIKILLLTIGSYIIVAFLQMKRVKHIPMDQTLKNIE